MHRLRRTLLRFVVVWLIEALSLAVMTAIIPSIAFVSSNTRSGLAIAMSAALALGIMNVLVRPLLWLLTLPLNVLTLGTFTLVVNAGMLMLTAHLLPGLVVSGWASAILGALALAAVNTFLTSLTTIDDSDSFFEGVVERLSARQHMQTSTEPVRGLVLLEIDGLSHSRMKRAAEPGLMPTVREMLRDNFTLSRCDCGLPSQTSACQAGIMYGDNHDIPAFRWYDKERGKMIISNNFKDAAELNARYATGHGLLRGGSGINNLM